MEELLVLGCGHAMALKCYNTCFALIDGESGEAFAVDAGGGNGILRNLRRAGLPSSRIHHFFITHSHTDHVLGAVWLIREIATGMRDGTYRGNLYIYCHAVLEQTVRAMCLLTLQQKLTDFFDRRILFQRVTDGCQEEILGWQVHFFDILSVKEKQFAFWMRLKSGKRLVFYGDEPCHPGRRALMQGADWALCEAFCLHGERELFKPYKKHHSTVQDACTLAEEAGVRNLVLWHTEDTHMGEDGPGRQARYLAEGRRAYRGNLYVPDELDRILL